MPDHQTRAILASTSQIRSLARGKWTGSCDFATSALNSLPKASCPTGEVVESPCMTFLMPPCEWGPVKVWAKPMSARPLLLWGEYRTRRVHRGGRCSQCRGYVLLAPVPLPPQKGRGQCGHIQTGGWGAVMCHLSARRCSCWHVGSPCPTSSPSNLHQRTVCTRASKADHFPEQVVQCL